MEDPRATLEQLEDTGVDAFNPRLTGDLAERNHGAAGSSVVVAGHVHLVVKVGELLLEQPHDTPARAEGEPGERVAHANRLRLELGQLRRRGMFGANAQMARVGAGVTEVELSDPTRRRTYAKAL